MSTDKICITSKGGRRRHRRLRSSERLTGLTISASPGEDDPPRRSRVKRCFGGGARLSRQTAAIPRVQQIAQPSRRRHPFRRHASVTVAARERERKIGRRAGPAVIHRIHAIAAGIAMGSIAALRRRQLAGGSGGAARRHKGRLSALRRQAQGGYAGCEISWRHEGSSVMRADSRRMPRKRRYPVI
jgi:hypothetical protein